MKDSYQNYFTTHCSIIIDENLPISKNKKIEMLNLIESGYLEIAIEENVLALQNIFSCIFVYHKIQ